MSKEMNLGPVTAYGIALQNGFVGTEAEWLETLKGEDGEQGVKGDTGNSGVYYGSGTVPDDCNVQVDPTGDGYSLEDLIKSVVTTEYIQSLIADGDEVTY